MCHNSAIMQNSVEQIEKFMQQGLPQKAVKSVEYALKKRAAASALRTSTIDISSCESDNEISCVAGRKTANPRFTSAHTDTDTTTPILRCPVTSKLLKLPQLVRSSTSDPKEHKHITNLSINNADIMQPQMSEVYMDMLARGTQLTKQFFERLTRVTLKLQHSKFYTMLTRTTQPAHIIVIGLVSFVLFTLWPDLLDANANHQSKIVTTQQQSPRSTLAAIAYLGAFATHFGAQIWMTFVSGLSLYFSLPRHTFGQCQQILFPRYFALNATLSIGMLILFIKYFHSGWNMAAFVQLAALALSAVIEVTVRLYLAPPMLHLMHEKYRIEDAIGSGQEVGSLVAGDLMQCPHYQRIHKAFRRIHMTVATGNMLILCATCVHLYYLAAKIQIT